MSLDRQHRYNHDRPHRSLGGLSAIRYGITGHLHFRVTRINEDTSCGLSIERFTTCQIYGEFEYGNAENNLAAPYQNGQGVSKDDAMAMSLFRQSAGRGNSVAQDNLGVRYATGRGVSKHYATAAAWFQKAMAQGDAQSRDDLARLKNMMHPMAPGHAIQHAASSPIFAGQGNYAAPQQANDQNNQYQQQQQMQSQQQWDRQKRQQDEHDAERQQRESQMAARQEQMRQAQEQQMQQQY